MIRGVGIDLCEVHRMEDALARDGFLRKYFTAQEQQYILSKGKAAAQSLAGHFAAKEAAVKALGCGIVLPLTDIEISHDEQGAPFFRLHGQAQARLTASGGTHLHLSITHINHVAAAVAVLEG